jgi:hypothetical protein
MKNAWAETLKLQIDIGGPFFALNFFIVKFHGLSYGQVSRLGKNGGRPGRTYTAISNKKGHLDGQNFPKNNLFFQKISSKFCFSHPFSYPNIIVC